MRRRRLFLPLLVLAIAAVVYLAQDADPVAPPPAPKPTPIDLRVPGMEMRAGPASPVPPPPPDVRPPATQTPAPEGR